jgi:pilus assembly protein Flp/PilA
MGGEETCRPFFLELGIDWRPAMRFVLNKLKDNKGATAIEYGLIAALIAIAAITAMTSVGTKLNSTFSNVSGKLK